MHAPRYPSHALLHEGPLTAALVLGPLPLHLVQQSGPPPDRDALQAAFAAGHTLVPAPTVTHDATDPDAARAWVVAQLAPVPRLARRIVAVGDELVANALRADPARATLAWTVTESSVWLAVSNAGAADLPGVQRALARALVERRPRESPSGGAGLGLYLAYLQSNRLIVEVESDRTCVAATFHRASPASGAETPHELHVVAR